VKSLVFPKKICRFHGIEVLHQDLLKKVQLIYSHNKKIEVEQCMVNVI
jgi:hypothetical protein